MKRNTMVIAVMFSIVLGMSATSQAIGEDWMDHFEKAKAKAVAEGKDLLVDFTGSDWCIWCIRLDKEVFQTDLFKNEAPKSFVLVAIDYPRDGSKLSEEIKQQNAKLKLEYGIRAYPTIYLMDAQGRPYAKTGYQAGGPENYLKHLTEEANKHKLRDEQFTLAKEASDDLTKARALDKALAVVGIPLARQFYTTEMEQIVALDSNNEAGLKQKYELLAFDQEMATLLSQNKIDDAAKALDKKLKALDLPEAEAQKLKQKYEQQMFDSKVRGLMRQQKYDDAIALIDEQIKTKNPQGQELINLQLTKVRMYASKGEHDMAIEKVDSLIKENHFQGDSLQQVLSLKAQIYQGKNDIEKMKETLTEAIKAAPETQTGQAMQRYLDRINQNNTK